MNRVPRVAIAWILAAMLLGAVALGAGPWTAPEDAKARKDPRPWSPDSIAAGQKVYEQRCINCHGKTGAGDGTDVEELGIHPAKLSDPATQLQTDGELFWKIKTGRRPMPSYGKRLALEEMWDSVRYIRSFAQSQ